MTKKNWNFDEIAGLYDQPFMELIFQAQSIHRQHFNANEIQLSTLLSIKTGTCPEDCAYCPQSGHYNTGVEKEKLLDVEFILKEAQLAKDQGATRFCMGAAWRSPPKKDFPKVLHVIKEVKKLGMETCVTLGMLDKEQAEQLKEAGLDYYNHNIDTSPSYYKKIISTRTFADRLQTLEHVRATGMNVCCGGIVGLGETRQDRIEFLLTLVNLPQPPKSVPINRLIAIKGTPLQDSQAIENFEFIRTIAVARILMPTSVVRLSAGRKGMSDEMQTLCFMAGANSLFLGDTLLTAENPSDNDDRTLLNKLGLHSTKLDCAVDPC